MRNFSAYNILTAQLSLIVRLVPLVSSTFSFCPTKEARKGDLKSRVSQKLNFGCMLCTIDFIRILVEHPCQSRLYEKTDQ
jgi:hypothetical protein